MLSIVALSFSPFAFTDPTESRRTRVSEDVGRPGPIATRRVWGDADGDALLDLYVTREGNEDRLFRNRGDGSFEDVTEASGLSGNVASRAVLWNDFDRDGEVDLVLLTARGSLRLYRGRGEGVFQETTGPFGLANTSGIASVEWMDYDGDGWFDLVLEEESGSLAFFHSLGGLGFEGFSMDLGRAVLDGPGAAAGTTTSGTSSAGNQFLMGGIGVLSHKVVEIGDWDMNATTSVQVPHGLGAKWKNIRSVTGIIRDDGDARYAVIGTSNTGADMDVFFRHNNGGPFGLDGTNITIQRSAGGQMGANAIWNDTSYNRGWVTIWYQP